MAVKERRKDSFLTYPVETTQTIESLTDAGYFYAAGKISLHTDWWMNNYRHWQIGEHSKPQEGSSNKRCH